MEEQQRGWQGAAGPPGPEAEEDEHNSPLFRSDSFRLWCMKVIPCTKRFVHDWTICPFAHAGEKAVRRDPRLHNYTGIACPDMKKSGNCIRGEKCPYAHNVFEYWLHPTRYRTQLCNDGPMCRRGICFFAHSLEELRVPACKPYVSPEALARASLEAIQQNPHPLGQQLANPVAAAAQQQAAMAAMSRSRSSRDSATSSLAANAMPFVPGHGTGGSGFRHSGELARYSAPSAGGLLASSGSSGNFGTVGSDYGSLPWLSYNSAQRWTHPSTLPPMHHGSYQQHNGSYPHNGGRNFLPLNQQHQQPYGSSMPAASRLSNNRGGGGSRGNCCAGSDPPDVGMETAAATAAATAVASASAGLRGQHQHQHQGASPPAQQYQQYGYPSAHVHASSLAGHAASPGPGPRSFAAVQHPPPQGFGSFSSAADGGGGDGGMPGCIRSVGAPGSVPSVHTSDSRSDEDGVPASPHSHAAGGTMHSGRASPADHDLAQSLASLKIAMTQQQLAAAAGSNHEVVITTLHQILKDAMAQQGGPSPASSFGANGDQSAAFAAVQQQLAAQLAGGGGSGGSLGGGHWGGGSPDANVCYSFGSSGPTMSGGSQPQFPPSPQSNSMGRQSDTAAGLDGKPVQAQGQQGQPNALSSSPDDAMACYHAALTAAAGGYPIVLPMGGGPHRASSMHSEARQEAAAAHTHEGLDGSNI